jgi:hypothetical protein
MFIEEVFGEISARLERSPCKSPKCLEQAADISDFQVCSLLCFRRTSQHNCKLFTEVCGMWVVDEPSGNSIRLFCLSSSFRMVAMCAFIYFLLLLSLLVLFVFLE